MEEINASEVTAESIAQEIDTTDALNSINTAQQAETVEEEAPIVPKIDVKALLKPKIEADPAMNKRFAALSRREKDIRERETKIAELEARLNSQSTPEQAQTEPELPLELRLKKDPIGTLQSLGLNYEKLTELALNDGKLTTDMQMELMRQEMDSKYTGELESIRAELAAKEQAATEEKHSNIIQGFKEEITSHVNSDLEAYELVKANDAVDLIFNVIEQHHEQTGEILDTKTAADHVETYLEDEFKKLFQAKKLQNLVSPAKSPSTPEPKAATLNSPTLSNELSSAVSNPTGISSISNDQSKADAAKLLKWLD